MAKYLSAIVLFYLNGFVFARINADESASVNNTKRNDEVLFYLYCTKNSTKVQEYQLTNQAPVIENSAYDTKKPTKFLIHGWTHEKDTPWLKEMREVMAYTKKWNVIVVDWSKLSRLPYVKSRDKTRDVGRLLGEFIIFLKENNFSKLSRVHLIGHSLGSHIAGFAAQTIKTRYNQTIERISGLDPAAPGFEYGNRTNERNARLDYEDAKFVDIIHTNGRILGMLNPIGHVDFYPNGGVTQPGCSSYYCSHVRACEFWTASVVHPGAYTGYRYQSWREYLGQKVHGGKSYPMGIEASPSIPPGSYFLETASEIPYVHYKTKLSDSL